MKKILAITSLSAALCGSIIATNEGDGEEHHTTPTDELHQLRMKMLMMDPTTREYDRLKLEYDNLASEQQRLTRDLGYQTRETVVKRAAS